jgi:predicted PurR-regulated permease PerM
LIGNRRDLWAIGADMALKRQLIFWVAALAVLIGFLWLFREILLPFIAGMALAYLLDPLVVKLERFKIGRKLAALLIVAVAIILCAVVVMLVAPLLAHQVTAFIDSFPRYVAKLQGLIADSNSTWLGRVLGERLPDAQKSMGTIASQGAGWLAAVAASIWSGGQALVSAFSLLILTPIVTLYLLFDWDRMIAAIDNWLPRRNRDTIRRLASDIDGVIAGFVRGQALCCVILGVLYIAGLVLLGVNFGFLIGLASAVLSFVPYVGTIFGLVVGGAIALVQFWPSLTPFLLVLALFAVGQAIEGNVLQPYLVGKTIGLHPVWLMFALFAFGYLFGFVGLLVAVPVAAAIGVLARFAINQYLTSPLYSGDNTG